MQEPTATCRTRARPGRGPEADGARARMGRAGQTRPGQLLIIHRRLVRGDPAIRLKTARRDRSNSYKKED